MRQYRNWELARKRAEMGKTMKELAKDAGVSYGTICKIENYHTIPQIHTVDKIAKAYGMSVTELRCSIHRAKVTELEHET